MTEIPQGYKNTEIGIIPDNWEVTLLGHLSRMKSGQGITSASIEENGDYPCYGGNGLRGFTKTYTHEGIFPLIGRQGALCGNVTLARGRFYASEHAVVVTPNQGVDAEWLSRILAFMNLNSISEASAQGGLAVSKILKLEAPFPQNEEQRAIATALADVDALIEAKRALLEKKRAIKQGAMQELLTGRRRLRGFPVTPMKKTDIGEIPEDWNVCKMGENGTFLTTASYTRSELSQYGDVACIHYGDIHTKYKTWLSLNREEVPHIDYSKVKNYPYLRDGDLIIADASEDYAGLSDWVELTDCQDKKCIGGLHTIVFRPIEDIFAFGYLGLISSIGIVKKQLISKTVGTKVYSLTASMLKDLLFPIPSTREEQASIYNVIRGMDSEVKAIESEIEKLVDLKEGMMQNLLTGRIRLV